MLRVKLRLDGEKVVGSECIIGYLHRGVEKIAEQDDVIFGGLAPHPVTRHYDQEGRRLASGNQCIGGLIRAQTVPLVVGIALSVDQVQDGIALLSVLGVTGWQIHPEFERKA